MNTPSERLGAAVEAALAELGWDGAVVSGWAVVVSLQTLDDEGGISTEYARLTREGAAVHEVAGLFGVAHRLELADILAEDE